MVVAAVVVVVERHDHNNNKVLYGASGPSGVGPTEQTFATTVLIVNLNGERKAINLRQPSSSQWVVTSKRITCGCNGVALSTTVHMQPRVPDCFGERKIKKYVTIILKHSVSILLPQILPSRVHPFLILALVLVPPVDASAFTVFWPISPLQNSDHLRDRHHHH